MRRVIILGATGSIGSQALCVCRAHRDFLKVVGIHTHTQIDKLFLIRKDFPDARFVVSGCIESQYKYEKIKLYAVGDRAVYNLITDTDADMVLNGISGSNGVKASFWALENGKDLALANKESLVIAGDLLLKIAEKHKRKILPVDSEHWALYDMLKNIGLEEINELVITASGGPFYGFSAEELKKVTPEQAIKHPTWKMGSKISIDSATLANKGLEVIEAWRFFRVPVDIIKVVVHRQSLIHAMLRLNDGSLQIQMSDHTMKLPIQNALLYPERRAVSGAFLNFDTLREITLEPVPAVLGPMLNLAYDVCHSGGFAPLIYNAANEAAVELFQKRILRFDQIYTTVSRALEEDVKCSNYASLSYSELYSVHQEVYKNVCSY